MQRTTLINKGLTTIVDYQDDFLNFLSGEVNTISNYQDDIYHFFYDKRYKKRASIQPELPKQVAEKFLKELEGPIRVLVSSAPPGFGYGDQVCAVNIIRDLSGRLKTLKKNIDIEIIGIFQPNNSESALFRTMQLFNVHPSLHESITSLVLFNGQKLRFIPLDYFEKNRQFSQVTLALVVGIEKLVNLDYNPSGYRQLTEIAKAKRLVRFNPFTGFMKAGHSGFYLQLERQAMRPVQESIILHYNVPKPSFGEIRQELLSFSSVSIIKADYVATLIKYKAAGTINTFAIYGINYPQPEYTLLNFIVSAMSINHKLNNKPLTVIILNTINDVSWHNLKKMILDPQIEGLKQALKGFSLADQIQFVDPNTYDRYIPGMAQFNIIRMGFLPQLLFNKVYVDSTYPPPYEGANAGTLLYNYGIQGIPCRRPAEPWRRVDGLKLPHLLSAIDFCDSYRLSWAPKWDQAKLPHEILGPLLLTYNNLENTSITKTGHTDRLTEALAQVSLAKDCDRSPALCAFFHPAAPSSWFNVAMFHANTAKKWLAYGIGAEYLNFCLQFIGLKKQTAEELIEGIFFLLQSSQLDSESDLWRSWLFLFFLTPILFSEKTLRCAFMHAAFSLYLYGNKNNIEVDFQGMSMLLSVIANSMVSELVGRSLTRWSFLKIIKFVSDDKEKKDEVTVNEQKHPISPPVHKNSRPKFKCVVL